MPSSFALVVYERQGVKLMDLYHKSQWAQSILAAMFFMSHAFYMPQFMTLAVKA